MAAATQVPAGTWVNKGHIQEAINDINNMILIGIFAGTDTVTVALANLATELATR